MPEIEGCEVEEVEDEHNLGDPEVRMDPEQDEGELQEVVDDEVGADVCGEGVRGGIAGEEDVEVVDLEYEEYYPVVDLTSVPGGCIEKGRPGEGAWLTSRCQRYKDSGRRALGEPCFVPILTNLYDRLRGRRSRSGCLQRGRGTR